MKSIVKKKMKKWSIGTLEISFPDDDRLFFQGNSQPHKRVHWRIKCWKALKALLLKNGDIGLGEGFINGEFEFSNLSQFLELMVVNMRSIDKTFFQRLHRRITNLKHAISEKNTKKQAKRNIKSHYDLGNDFYELFLGEDMAYSSGLWLRDDDDLDTAQRNKLTRVIEQISPAQSVLEIGCGWGSFLRYAQKNNMKYKGLTLSPAQLEYCEGKFPQESGVVLQDYRDETEKFDAIVSIEMIEAVGKKYWPSYFNTLKKALKPGGKCLIQAIVIADQYWKAYRKGTDYIRQHIFPGGFLPCPEQFKRHAMSAGLTITNAFSMQQSYANTLELWDQRCLAVKDKIITLFGDQFFRKWRFYLQYCKVGFESKRLDVIQYTLCATESNQHDL